LFCVASAGAILIIMGMVSIHKKIRHVFLAKLQWICWAKFMIWWIMVEWAAIWWKSDLSYAPYHWHWNPISGSHAFWQRKSVTKLLCMVRAIQLVEKCHNLIYMYHIIVYSWHKVTGMWPIMGFSQISHTMTSVKRNKWELWCLSDWVSRWHMYISHLVSSRSKWEMWC
jgi:hypothetical protein